MPIVYNRDGSLVQVREAIGDIYHSLEDQNWQDISMDPMAVMGSRTFDKNQRLNVLRTLRNIARNNPVAKQILAMGAHYTFGTGLTIKTVNVEDAPYVRPVIARFWSHPHNQRTLTSLSAQTARFIELTRDGDLFLLCIVDPVTGLCQWTRVDADRVDDITSDPNDANVPRFYRVRHVVNEYDYNQGVYASSISVGENNYIYYRDWRYEPQPGDVLPPRGLTGNGVIYHLRINHEGKFGLSDLYASRDWLLVHKSFMEDRASITKAMHTYAWIVTRKDSPAGIQQAALNTQSTWVSQPLTGFDAHPNPAAGATLFQNEGSTREPVRIDTGSRSAVEDGEGFLQMAGIGAGIIGTHYLGSVQAHRLATVTAMELPMLKHFQWKQQYWKNVYEDILQYQVDQAIIAGVIPGDASRYTDDGRLYAGFGDSEELATAVEGSQLIDRDIRVDFPPILIKDIANYINAITHMASLAPVNVPSRKILVTLALNSMGVEDVESVVEHMFPKEDTEIQLETISKADSIVKNEGQPGDSFITTTAARVSPDMMSGGNTEAGGRD